MRGNTRVTPATRVIQLIIQSSFSIGLPFGRKKIKRAAGGSGARVGEGGGGWSAAPGAECSERLSLRAMAHAFIKLFRFCIDLSIGERRERERERARVGGGGRGREDSVASQKRRGEIYRPVKFRVCTTHR